jgi:hypothetical protein
MEPKLDSGWSIQVGLTLEEFKMTKREVAFLLMGLGSGLVAALAFVCFPEIFFFVFSWRHGFLLALFLLLIVGSIFLLRLRGHAKPVDSN